MSASIYKSPETKAKIWKLYDERIRNCNIEYEEVYVDTFAGKTHVIITGEPSGPPLIVLHGINAGAPMALEAVKGLGKHYRIYAFDTVGQATKSSETRLPMNDKSYGKWIAETMDGLGIKQAYTIGISFGGFLLQKAMSYCPERILKGIMVVPGGLVNGAAGTSFAKLSIPLMKFLFTKKEKHLVNFMNAFYDDKETKDIAFQKHVLLGIKMDYRRPALLQAEDVKEMKHPVYAIVVDNDIFFPGNKALERCKKLFPDFRDSYILRNTKHIPSASKFAEIESKIVQWLAE
ncbi:MAG: alpha/beta hydrolase [Bacteroidetes bacterium]|nr:alpha/beta hydrolase [Bacteroidota bacterium]